MALYMINRGILKCPHKKTTTSAKVVQHKFQMIFKNSFEVMFLTTRYGKIWITGSRYEK